MEKFTLKYQNENLPVVENPDIILKKNEICHKIGYVNLYEFRTRSGHSSLKYVDFGTIFFTNQRIIFSSPKKNVAYQLNKLADISREGNGFIKFAKENEASPKLFQHDSIVELIDHFTLAKMLVENVHR